MELLTILSVALLLAIFFCFEIALGKRIKLTAKFHKFLFAWMPAICLSFCAVALVPYTYLCNPGTRVQAVWLNAMHSIIWIILAIGSALEILRLVIFTKK